MKDHNEAAAALKRLYNRLKRQYGSGSESAEHPPTQEMILACLASKATEKQAHTAWNRLKGHFVDFNELRVARVEDIVEVLGKAFPEAREAAVQITVMLRDIYNQRDSLDLDDLAEMSKREVKTFLQNIKGASGYVVARVLLNSLDIHAFPVNDQVLAMLRREGAIGAAMTVEEAGLFLEKHIPARQAKKIFWLLTQYAAEGQGNRTPLMDAGADAPRKIPARRNSAAGQKRPGRKKKNKA